MQKLFTSEYLENVINSTLANYSPLTIHDLFTIETIWCAEPSQLSASGQTPPAYPTFVLFLIPNSRSNPCFLYSPATLSRK